jgi:hypothetical protein
MIRQAVGLDPEDAFTAFYIASACERVGDREEALRWIGRALEGGYTREDVESTPLFGALTQDSRYLEHTARLGSS